MTPEDNRSNSSAWEEKGEMWEVWLGNRGNYRWLLLLLYAVTITSKSSEIKRDIGSLLGFKITDRFLMGPEYVLLSMYDGGRLLLNGPDHRGVAVPSGGDANAWSRTKRDAYRRDACG